ncbi:MAG: hypothetical protein QGI21_05055 [Candidatus Poseidoniaceae archaeon]|nr:hypothetical protein [Candidatus Poseidoniaceae archaeon]
MPSKKTASVREYLTTQGWLAEGYGIQSIGDNRAIPLNDKAPQSIKKYKQITLSPLSPPPKHWTERLDLELFTEYKEYWPMSHDQIGDIIILKLPSEIIDFGNTIGEAILQQFPNMRVVCADKGVTGKFRVRDLQILSSRNKQTTETIVRENGNEMIVNPSVAYYSPRLANERLLTVESAKKLKNRLGRPLDVCDPYAGVGPSLVTLLSEKGLTNKIYGSDLNPAAVPILKQNIGNHWAECRDARDLSKEHPQCADLLLVNLPHESINHLSKLIGLLKKNQETVIRGWAIIDNESIDTTKQKLEKILDEYIINDITISPSKSYSPKESYASFEISLTIN